MFGCVSGKSGIVAKPSPVKICFRVTVSPWDEDEKNAKRFIFLDIIISVELSCTRIDGFSEGTTEKRYKRNETKKSHEIFIEIKRSK
jgi:hypothetical protein